MKITDVEVIEFRTHDRAASQPAGATASRCPSGQTRERQHADEDLDRRGRRGLHARRRPRPMIEAVAKPLLVGENPLDREKLWHWMDQMITFGHRLQRDAGRA